MSARSSFKWMRAIPLGSPGFYSLNLSPMKQIPVSLGTATAAGGLTPVITAHVPSSSWALNKNLLVRGFYQLVIPGGPLPANYNILEAIVNVQSGPIFLPTPPPFVPLAGIFSTWIQRNIVRIDPLQYGVDLGDAMQFNFANFDDSIQHVMPIAATAPPFDYSVQIDESLSFQLPGTIPGCTLQCLWAEAFLEQATNLGRLP